MTVLEKEQAHAAVMDGEKAAREAILNVIRATGCTERQAWIIYGRIINLLFTSHYKASLSLANEVLEVIEKREERRSMTELEKLLAEIEAADKLATAGPWIRDYPLIIRITDSKMGSQCIASVDESFQNNRFDDAHFIALARTALPRLAAVVREYEAALSEIVRDGGRNEWQVARKALNRAEEIVKGESVSTCKMDQAQARTTSVPASTAPPLPALQPGAGQRTYRGE